MGLLTSLDSFRRVWSWLLGSDTICAEKEGKKIKYTCFSLWWLENAVLVFYRHALFSVITKYPEPK